MNVPDDNITGRHGVVHGIASIEVIYKDPAVGDSLFVPGEVLLEPLEGATDAIVRRTFEVKRASDDRSATSKTRDGSRRPCGCVCYKQNKIQVFCVRKVSLC